MKQVKDVLSSLCGCIRFEDGREIIHYIEDEGGMRVHKTKDVTFYTTEIEDKWTVSHRPELLKDLPPNRCVGCSIFVSKDFIDLEDEKRKVFISILQRILIDDLEPECGVTMFVEDAEDFWKITGICKIRHGNDLY